VVRLDQSEIVDLLDQQDLKVQRDPVELRVPTEIQVLLDLLVLPVHPGKEVVPV